MPLVPMRALPPYLPASAFFASPSLLHSSLLSLQSFRSLCSPLVLFAVLSFPRAHPLRSSQPRLSLQAPLYSTLHSSLLSLQSFRSLCSPLVLYSIPLYSLCSSLVLFAVLSFPCAHPLRSSQPRLSLQAPLYSIPLSSLCSPLVLFAVLSFSLQSSRSLCSLPVSMCTPSVPTNLSFLCKPFCRDLSSLLSILQSLSVPSQPRSLSIFLQATLPWSFLSSFYIAVPIYAFTASQPQRFFASHSAVIFPLFFL